MSQVGRKKILRHIEKDHTHIYFKLCNTPDIYLEKTELHSDEMEATRFSDFKDLHQQECRDNMVITRTTFSKLIKSAHKKMADVLLYRKAIAMTT
ncbi:DUF134 domain-containing protein [Sulfurovum sp.]|uniref:DUF134 domain-containing protein n=1 Tax=Sulfurovum sp. TaxID=1969726 RepID=UPI0028681320|nr:DUF134 domain-containing protein [Sulfurovum sp.]